VLARRERAPLGGNRSPSPSPCRCRVHNGEGRRVHIPWSGKAVALNLLIECARGEIQFFTDVRQTLQPDASQLTGLMVTKPA
jgi:hypothetical protein